MRHHYLPILLASILALTACGDESPSSNHQSDAPNNSEQVEGRTLDTSQIAGLGCAWQVASEPDIANYFFPDEASRYWIALVPVTPGSRIRIDGRFPNARYFSFNSYDAAFRPQDAIADIEVLSERNPFASSGLPSGGSYSAFLEFGQRPDTKAPGTFYSGGLNVGPIALPNPILVPLVYRIYVSHEGERLDGGVGLPQLSIEAPNGSSITLPTCDEPILPTLGGHAPGNGLNELLLELDYPDEILPLPFPTATYPPKTNVFFGLTDTYLNILGNVLPALNSLARDQVPETGSGGFLSNIHNEYTASAFARKYGNLFLLRAKAPSWRGKAGTSFGSEQVRYWSVCQNEFVTQRYTACSIDQNTPLDDDGYFTVAVSDMADRPVFSKNEDGITWLPWGPYPDGLLLYRQMLANPLFAEAMQNVSKGDSLESIMGEFAPQVTYCRLAVFDQPNLTPAQRFAACQQDQQNSPAGR